MKKIIYLSFLLLLMACPLRASVVDIQLQDGKWALTVDGAPYKIRGVAYAPVKVGESPNFATQRNWMFVDDNRNGRNDFAYDSFVDVNANNQQDASEPTVGDFQLLQEMGVNTIRIYHHASNDPSVQAGYGNSTNTRNLYNHAPNKDLMRDLYETYGIRVAMGDYLGAYTIGSGVAWPNESNYNDDTHKERMRASVRQMVLDFKDEDFLLMYVLGNENNLSGSLTSAYSDPIGYAQFIGEMATMIHEMDPNHPVVVCLGDRNLSTYLNALEQYAPTVIVGVNLYRGRTFNGVPELARQEFDRPFLLTEYGYRNHTFPNGTMDLDRQLQYHQSQLQEINLNEPGNIIGGFAFQWLDKWWPRGSPSAHDISGSEWHGIFSQGNGRLSPFLREKRPVYDMYQKAWTANAPPIAVVERNFIFDQILMGDGLVGTGDLVAMLQTGSYEKNKGDLFYDPIFDWNNDDMVGTGDLIELFISGAYENPENYDRRFDVNNSQLMVELNGSASTDPEGEPLTYQWTDQAGNIRGTDPIINLKLPIGIHRFLFKVTDPKGQTGETTVTVSLTRAAGVGSPDNIVNAAAAADISHPPQAVDIEGIVYRAGQNQPDSNLDTGIDEFIQLTIYDRQGREIRTLGPERRHPVNIIYSWDGRDTSGQRVPSGTYLLHHNSDVFKKRLKLVVIN